MTRSVLQDFFNRIDSRRDLGHDPEARLHLIRSTLFELEGKISSHIADFLEASRTRRRPTGLPTYDLITRVDTPLHSDDAGDYECVLHHGREPITPESEVRPHINAKGYWMLTVLLGGAMEVQYYANEWPSDPAWIPVESLRPTSIVTLGPRNTLVLGPDQIHRLNRIEKGTVTLTFRVLRGAGKYRDYIPHLKHYAVYEREPRASRLTALAANLRKLDV